MRILIVDDNSDDRRLLRYIVENKGHEPIEAEDGLDGLRMAKIHTPDLIISDALMPLMDGFQFLRAIKGDERLRSIPFIFYSAIYRADKDVDLAIALGAEAYIIKPQEPSDLWDEVEIILQAQKREKVITPILITEEEDYLKRYSQVVAAKIEEKVAELEKEIAERKRMEEQIKKAEEEWERSFDAIVDPIMILDTSHRIIRANKAMSAALGITPEEAEGLSCFKAVHGTKEPPVFCPLSRLLKDGQPHSAEVSEPRLGGHFIISVSPLFTPEGMLYGSIHCARDITERKRNEEELKKTNELLERIFSSTHILIAYLDRGFNFIRVNRAYAEADGRNPAFFIGKNHFALYPNAENEFIFRRVLETGEPFICYEKPFEYAGHPERGVTYWDWSLAPVLDDAGGVESLVLSLKDVTGRKRAEEKNRQLAAIVESSDDAIISKTLDGSVLSWNKGAEVMYGYSAEDMKGRAISVLVPPDCPDDVPAILDKISRGGHIDHYETTRVRKDGRRIYVSMAVSPITDSTGRIVGACAIERDITEQKKLQERLWQAQKMEAVGTLSGGIAHDFNNILSAVIGYADLLFAGLPEGDPRREYVVQILEAADRATHLTRGLLTFSRKQEMNVRPVDMNEIIGRAEKFLRGVIGGDIELKTTLCKEPLCVSADTGQMEQVLMNLAVNSHDAMPNGGKVVIETDRIELDATFEKVHGYGRPGAYALIVFTDTGFGMDRMTLEKIFEPFFTTKATGRGTGLGLAIVYGIIKQHNGFISADSEPGRGTTFKIYIPLIAANLSETFENGPRSIREAAGRHCL